MHRRHLFAIVLVACVIIGGSVFWWRSSSIEVMRPLRGPAIEAVYATGTVESTVMFPVASRVTGRLTELLVDENDTVAPDQVLGKLESADVTATLAQLRAREMYAIEHFRRAEALYKRDVSSKASYDSALTDMKVATESRKAAEAQVGYTELRATSAATVIARDGEIGQLIPANQPIFWLAEEGPLRLTAQVDEEDIIHVQPGQEALIRSDAFAGQVFRGRVEGITPKGDPVARSFRVRIGLPEDTPLKIGMTAEANIILRSKEDALLIPNSALAGGAIWAVVDGRLKLQPVTTGAVGVSLTEVVDGLSSESLFAVVPQVGFKSGQHRRVRLSSRGF